MWGFGLDLRCKGIQSRGGLGQKLISIASIYLKSRVTFSCPGEWVMVESMHSVQRPLWAPAHFRFDVLQPLRRWQTHRVRASLGCS